MDSNENVLPQATIDLLNDVADIIEATVCRRDIVDKNTISHFKELEYRCRRHAVGDVSEPTDILPCEAHPKPGMQVSMDSGKTFIPTHEVIVKYSDEIIPIEGYELRRGDFYLKLDPEGIIADIFLSGKKQKHLHTRFSEIDIFISRAIDGPLSLS